jgi:hypothetical protein
MPWVFAVLGDAPRPGSYEVQITTDAGTGPVGTAVTATLPGSGGPAGSENWQR